MTNRRESELGVDVEDTHGLSEGEAHFLLQKQTAGYQRLRDKSSRIIQLVLSVVSLAASIGFLQLLFSGSGRVSGLQIAASLANRCAPEAITHSDVALRGLGKINFLLVVGMLGLASYLLIEMVYVNTLSESLPPLRPHNEIDLYINDYSDLIMENRRQMKQARNYLTAVKDRLYYAGGLVIASTWLLVQLIFNRPMYLLVADPVVTLIGFGLLVYWIHRQITVSGTGFFRWETHSASPLFIALFALVWLYSLWETYLLYQLLDYLIIC